MDHNLVPLAEVLKVSGHELKEKWCRQLLYKLNIIHNSFENFHCNICFDNLLVDRNNNLVLTNVSEKSKTERKSQNHTAFIAPELLINSNKIRSKEGDIWASGICIFYINNSCYPWKIAANTDERYCMWAKEGILPSNLENSCSKIVKQMLCVDPKLRPSVKNVIKSVHGFKVDYHNLSELLFFYLINV